MYNKYVKSLAIAACVAFSVPALATQTSDAGELLDTNEGTYTAPTLEELTLINVLNQCPSEEFEPYAQKELAPILPGELIEEARQFLLPSNYTMLMHFHTKELLTGAVFTAFKDALENSNRIYNNHSSFLKRTDQSLKATKHFSLSVNDIAVFPQALIEEMPNLEALELNNNKLATVAAEIGQLTNLVNLDLHGNQLTTVPAGIGRLTNLSKLILYGNQLTTVPAEIGQLTNLRSLWLDANKVTTLPPEICQLTNLSELYLNGNQLTTVPAEIGRLTSLTTLELRDNKLITLPPEICQLTNITKLKLTGNQLTTLPAEIRQLTNLKKLSLEDNPVQFLPLSISHMDPEVRAKLQREEQ